MPTATELPSLEGGLRTLGYEEGQLELVDSSKFVELIKSEEETDLPIATVLVNNLTYLAIAIRDMSPQGAPMLTTKLLFRADLDFQNLAEFTVAYSNLHSNFANPNSRTEPSIPLNMIFIGEHGMNAVQVAKLTIESLDKNKRESAFGNFGKFLAKCQRIYTIGKLNGVVERVGTVFGVSRKVIPVESIEEADIMIKRMNIRREPKEKREA